VLVSLATLTGLPIAHAAGTVVYINDVTNAALEADGNAYFTISVTVKWDLSSVISSPILTEVDIAVSNSAGVGHSLGGKVESSSPLSCVNGSPASCFVAGKISPIGTETVSFNLWITGASASQQYPANVAAFINTSGIDYSLLAGSQNFNIQVGT
jgi:hypothetical protein